ncbi:MAG: MerR family transcriptional regulator [Paludibacteraceae bacterium]|nr:MerR family transcriptional regulator [Paludibacteraceae bacterium]
MAEGKRYYKINEVAQLLGVEASTLRYWETEFPSLSPRRNDTGKRLYTESDIEDARRIYFLLKKKNLTIKGAQAALADPKKVNRQYEVVKRLQEIKGEVTKLKEEVGTLLKHTISIEEL